MALRIYLPASGAAGLAALAFDAGWNKTSQATRLKGVLAKIDTALTTRSMLSSAATPELHCCVQYQLAGLAAQSLSGTVKGQTRANVNNVLFAGTIAIGIRVVSAAGVVRGTALAVSASDSASTPPRLNTALTNRPFMDVSENAALALTPVACQTGDVLVIELGSRDVDTGTARSCFLSVGDPIAAADLPEDSTTTTALCPWIEFSANLVFGLPRSMYGAMM